jgi:hypothetical protein
MVENECKWIYETSSFRDFVQKIEHDPIPFTLHPTKILNYYSVNFVHILHKFNIVSHEIYEQN